jgi:hypothetical protein
MKIKRFVLEGSRFRLIPEVRVSRRYRDVRVYVGRQVVVVSWPRPKVVVSLPKSWMGESEGV